MTVTVLQGDVIAMLRTLPDDHFGCVVTSPPYWGLRDYGVEGQLGLEPTLAEHLAKMVEVFNEVRRVLKPDGTCWVNYGDCYATSPNGRSAADTKAVGTDDRTFRDKPFSTIQGAMKAKDLCMVPNRFAIAMQDAGWWVRAECIWAKPNPMPESIRDRPATAHEKVFLFTKQPRYHWDAEAVRQGLAPSSVSRYAQDIDSQAGSTRANGGRKKNGTMKAVGGKQPLAKPDANKSTLTGGAHGRHSNADAYPEADRRTDKRQDKQRGHSRKHDGFNDRWDQMSRDEQSAGGRSLRNWEPAPVEVWTIATRPFSEAHFATFPPELVERCLKASLRPGDAVLDPFGGSGTTGLVADAFGADCTLIELNPEYAELARRRLAAGLVRLDRPAQPETTKREGQLF